MLESFSKVSKACNLFSPTDLRRGFFGAYGYSKNQDVTDSILADMESDEFESHSYRGLHQVELRGDIKEFVALSKQYNACTCAELFHEMMSEKDVDNSLTIEGFQNLVSLINFSDFSVAAADEKTLWLGLWNMEGSEDLKFYVNDQRDKLGQIFIFQKPKQIRKSLDKHIKSLSDSPIIESPIIEFPNSQFWSFAMDESERPAVRKFSIRKDKNINWKMN